MSLAIVKACAAVTGKANKAGDYLEDVPAEARRDLGYVLCRAQWHLQKDRIDDAAEVILAAAPETMAAQDTDAWWRERRLLARKLLDQGKPRTAYDVVRTAAVPEKEVYRVDYHFMCGWIALRFLSDPKAAMVHFAAIDEGSANPIALSRAHYWRGRAAEAMGASADARMSYRAASRYPTAYYGQLARAKLGLDRIELRPPSPVLAAADTPASDERVRAADMLYGIGERDVAFYYAEDFARESTDVAALEALGEARRAAQRCARDAGGRQVGAGARARARPLRLPDHRHPRAQAGRACDRDQRDLFGGAHRKLVRPARQVRRQRGRADAGDAGSRPRHRETLRPDL